MRPRLIIRLLVVLIMLALLAVGLGFLAVALGLVDQSILIRVIQLPYASANNGWITAGIGAGIIILAVIIMAGVNRRAPKAEKAPATAVISAGELGSTSITLAAIDEMVRRYCSNIEGVKSCHATIAVKEDKLSIALKLSMAEDAKVAQVAENLRNGLVNYIQDITGITVSDVGIMVVTAPEQKAPVQA